jgi:hypothetical protein
MDAGCILNDTVLYEGPSARVEDKHVPPTFIRLSTACTRYYSRLYVHIYIMHVYVCIYIHTHTHTHTNTYYVIQGPG